MRARAGHTLVELLVVVTIAALLVTVSMVAWKPLSHSILSLRDRAQDGAELRLVVESLLADFGGAATALPTPDGELHITREQAVAELAGAWDGGDAGVLYSLADDRLLRWDLALDAQVVLATGIRTFEITRPGAETHIALSVGEGTGLRFVELVWPQ